MSDSLKEQHDQLLKDAGDDVEHDAASCVFCDSEIDPEEGGDKMTEKTYTEDDFTQAVQAAVAPIQAAAEAKVSDLQKQVDDLTNEKAKGEIDSQIDEVQKSLDAAVLSKQALEEELANVKAYLEAEKVAADEAAAIEARRSDRTEKIDEIPFPEGYLSEARIEKVLALSDEDFEAQLEDWKALVPAKAELAESDADKKVLTETAMNNEQASGKSELSVADILGVRQHGIDIRDLRS